MGTAEAPPPHHSGEGGNGVAPPTAEGAREEPLPQVTKGGPGSVSADELYQMNSEKSDDSLGEMGGIRGIAASLGVDLAQGVRDEADAGRLRAEYGRNDFESPDPKSLFSLFLDQLQDPTLILLMVLALLSTILGSAIPEEREELGYVDGIAIWVAVLVVSGVGAVNDWQKDKQFRVLNDAKNVIEVKVRRGGRECTIWSNEVVVGDVLLIDAGDKFVADGVYIEGHDLVADEASLTGESEPVAKNEKKPFCRSGTQATEGEGKVLVLAVGERSEWGETMSKVMGEVEDTPLQEKLGVLAEKIGKVGFGVAAVCFVVLFVSWMIRHRGWDTDESTEVLDYFLFATTIIVVAIPEGLPLAVTIALAYSMKRMMDDNNFVRVLAACETMGGATCICSDKTGTLTENKMTVTEGWFMGIDSKSGVPAQTTLPADAARALTDGVALNSKAFLVDPPPDAVAGTPIEFVGNRTECALLVMCRELGEDYRRIRDARTKTITKMHQFTSDRKRSSVVAAEGAGSRLHIKGAAEIVLRSCVSQVDTSGAVVAMSQEGRHAHEEYITAMASRGLRTLAIAYRDFAPNTSEGVLDDADQCEADLVLLALVGIKDPVRKEVPGAVMTCMNAGIRVRMVTGDNVHTAKHIARECGILTDGDAMEGPEFRKLSPEQMREILPKLQVLARSSPSDKYLLVSALKEMGEVVAVTGDGTNDAPALKVSDVGLSMGITGTEVAKEASDIVILDDNFNSIVASVSWGRCVFANIRKFLQFQLTINGVALIVATLAAVTQRGMPLNVLQLLWVNLIMDSMAALALATEKPNPELLNERPHGREEGLISRTMWKHIIVQAVFQVAVLMAVLWVAPLLDQYQLPKEPTLGMFQCRGLDKPEELALETRPMCCIGENVNATTYTRPALAASGPVEELTFGECCKCSKIDDADCAGELEAMAGATGTDFDGEVPVETLFELDWTAVVDAPTKSCSLVMPEVDWPEPDEEVHGACCCHPDWSKRTCLPFKHAHEEYEHANLAINSLVFNVFIFMELFNFINARKINDELNIFKGIFDSYIFFAVLFFILVFQVIIMEALGSFFKVQGQTWEEWLFAIAVGIIGWPLALVTKILTPSKADLNPK